MSEGYPHLSGHSDRALLEQVHVAVYGDGNGKKGALIRLDRVETWLYHVYPKGALLFLSVITVVGGAVWWAAQNVVFK